MTDDPQIARIAADPRYHALLRRRGRFTWTLASMIVAAYIGFILLIAFDKPFLARPIGDGVMTIGIVIGFGVILLAIALTGVYVARAAAVFDPLVDAIREDTRA